MLDLPQPKNQACRNDPFRVSDIVPGELASGCYTRLNRSFSCANPVFSRLRFARNLFIKIATCSHLY